MLLESGALEERSRAEVHLTPSFRDFVGPLAIKPGSSQAPSAWVPFCASPRRGTTFHSSSGSSRAPLAVMTVPTANDTARKLFVRFPPLFGASHTFRLMFPVSNITARQVWLTREYRDSVKSAGFHLRRAGDGTTRVLGAVGCVEKSRGAK